jgi:mRNA-degrading endonuclease RelE of RelBE toxin-antitoxin system
MQSFQVVAGNSVKKDLRKLPDAVLERVVLMFERLSIDPFSVGAEKMTDEQGFKVRVGDYRIRLMWIYRQEKL